MKKQSSLTMWDVVKTVQDTAGSDEEVVAVIAHLLETRRVVLTAGDEQAAPSAAA